MFAETQWTLPRWKIHSAAGQLPPSGRTWSKHLVAHLACQYKSATKHSTSAKPVKASEAWSQNMGEKTRSSNACTTKSSNKVLMIWDLHASSRKSSMPCFGRLSCPPQKACTMLKTVPDHEKSWWGLAREAKPNLHGSALQTCCHQLAVLQSVSICDFTLSLSLSLWQISDFTKSLWLMLPVLSSSNSFAKARANHDNQVTTRFFKVTFWSQAWRSLSLSKKATSGSQRSHFEVEIYL